MAFSLFLKTSLLASSAFLFSSSSSFFFLSFTIFLSSALALSEIFLMASLSSAWSISFSISAFLSGLRFSSPLTTSLAFNLKAKIISFLLASVSLLEISFSIFAKSSRLLAPWRAFSRSSLLSAGIDSSLLASSSLLSVTSLSSTCSLSFSAAF